MVTESGISSGILTQWLHKGQMSCMFATMAITLLVARMSDVLNMATGQQFQFAKVKSVATLHSEIAININ